MKNNNIVKMKLNKPQDYDELDHLLSYALYNAALMKSELESKNTADSSDLTYGKQLAYYDICDQIRLLKLNKE